MIKITIEIYDEDIMLTVKDSNNEHYKEVGICNEYHEFSELLNGLQNKIL